MIACIDGGLFCVVIPVLLTVFCPAVVVWMRRKFKWCKKTCKCDCHDTLDK